VRIYVASAIAVIAILASALIEADAQTTPPTLAKFKNPSLPPEERARDLISNMTLEEKAAQLGHTAPAIARLGIPEYNWWNEGLHGVARADVATVFPQAIGMAASWDVPLMHRVANVLGTEFRAKYVEKVHPNGGTDWYRGLTVWSPNINIFRDPRWGRGQETYGEDPFLTSQLGVAFVSELQGSDPKYLKAIATPKHFAVHSGPESTRHTADVHVSRHDLEDTYLPAFRATVMEAKAQSVMCAYNAINGEPACANGTLLQEHLRKDWGFQGYVVSDCGAAADVFIPDGHKFAPNAEAGVTAAFKAGMDLICGDYRNNMSTEPTAIVGAVRHGLLPESVLDRALTRLFTARIKLGMFDPAANNIYSKIPASQYDTPAHREVSLQMAKESLVLLKNSGNLLPLKKAPGVIAVIGPNADELDPLVGNYNGTPSRPVTILAGIRARFPQSKVVYVKGTKLVEADTSADKAVEAARGADLVVMVAGLTAHIEGEEMKVNAQGFAGGDRTSLDLPAPQEQLLQRVQAVGKPIVLVLMNGSALGINWADQHVPAIVEAWYPGEQGGTAVAALLAGDFSPGGRLPVTFYKSVDQLPPFDDYSMSKRTYRYFSGEPLYPFGYGLSFATFSYSNSHVSKTNVAATDTVTISVDVTNSGAVAGDEVVQLYLTQAGIRGAPLRALNGFQRIHLNQGEKRTVEFTLHDRELSIVDDGGKHRIIPGQVAVWVGGGQPVSRPGLSLPQGVKTQFAISSSATLPD
jgi:beta-glucosidase